MASPLDLLTPGRRELLDEEIKAVFSGQEGLLHNMFHYQMGWMDQHGNPTTASIRHCLHPMMCLAACESLSGDFMPALPAAAAVELVYNFSLIHEDIQSGNPNRGSRESLWWIWGPGQAINAGDGMHAIARLALMRMADNGAPADQALAALRTLDKSCLDMFEGQHQDLVFQERLDVGVASYLKMAELKAGALTGLAMSLGAMCGGGSNEGVAAFGTCGARLGTAWQIQQDAAELWSGGTGSVPSHTLNKKKLFPVVLVLETAELSVKRELGTLYFKRVLEAPDVQKIGEILNGLSAKDRCQEKVEELCREALAALDGMELTESGREQVGLIAQHIRDLCR